jgi:hypothetical protein
LVLSGVTNDPWWNTAYLRVTRIPSPTTVEIFVNSSGRQSPTGPSMSVKEVIPHGFYPTDVTIDNTGLTATVGTYAKQNLAPGDVVLLSGFQGAGAAALNGEFEVDASTEYSFRVKLSAPVTFEVGLTGGTWCRQWDSTWQIEDNLIELSATRVWNAAYGIAVYTFEDLFPKEFPWHRGTIIQRNTIRMFEGAATPTWCHSVFLTHNKDAVIRDNLVVDASLTDPWRQMTTRRTTTAPTVVNNLEYISGQLVRMYDTETAEWFG